MTPKDASWMVRRLHLTINKLVEAEREYAVLCFRPPQDVTVLKEAFKKKYRASKAYAQIRETLYVALVDRP